MPPGRIPFLATIDREGCAGSVASFESTGATIDLIGPWTEVKLEIIRKYAQAYAIIMSKRRTLWSVYVDGFAGPGLNIARGTGEFVPGSPLNALRLDPGFDEYYLIDLEGAKADQLRLMPEVRDRNVHVMQGDCNTILLEKVFPQLRYEHYRRALCVLDPYGLHLDWEVLREAGRMRSVEIFLNFPMMDINRNVLWRRPDVASEDKAERLTRCWGDTSWKDKAYSAEETLFGIREVKRRNIEIAEAFRERLRSIGGFQHVPEPLPMRNSKNAVLYYLFFAGQRRVGTKIVSEIFSKYRGGARNRG